MEQLLDDLDAGTTRAPTRQTEVRQVLAERRVQVIDLAGWQAIDREELRRGAAAERPRTKIVTLDELRATATSRLRETV